MLGMWYFSTENENDLPGEYNYRNNDLGGKLGI